MFMQVNLNFYDLVNSTTTTNMSCSTPMCECTRTKQCGYILNYNYGSGTTVYFVSDI